MTPLFKKLNFKQQKEIFILNYPAEFDKEYKEMKHYAAIKTNIENSKGIEFILTFVTSKYDVDRIVPAILKKLKQDGIIWFAYPKGSSKKYKAEINRDNGWDVLVKSGFETVRAVAIDEDWSALRFRRSEFIKSNKPMK